MRPKEKSRFLKSIAAMLVIANIFSMNVGSAAAQSLGAPQSKNFNETMRLSEPPEAVREDDIKRLLDSPEAGIGTPPLEGAGSGSKSNTSSDLESAGFGVAVHTEDEIKAFIKANGADVDDPVTFKSIPSASYPYALGELSDETKESALKMLNNVRYIAGLNSDVVLSSEYGELAQAASLVNAANDVMSHYPEKPSDMSEELYSKGAQGARQSNLAWGTDDHTLNLHLLHGWMSDDDDGNIDRVGHRRWCLNPGMKATGFGFVSANSFYHDYYQKHHAAMYALDEGRGADETLVAWPARSMPLEYFQDSDPWSLSVGDEVNKDAVTVRLTRRSDGKEWLFDSASDSSGYFNVNNVGYGQVGCIIFRPNEISYEDGDVFDVVISGATDEDIAYSVSFFSLKYKVTFDTGTYGSSYVKAQSVIADDMSRIKEPDSPTDDDCEFEGWYVDPGFSRKWNFSDAVTSDMTLYAKWLCTVSFDTLGGSSVSSQKVVAGEKALQPEDPARSGYEFLGWFGDSDGWWQWDFDYSPVYEDRTIYAKWRKIPQYFTVSFDSLGGTEISSQSIKEGDMVESVYPQGKEGFIFKGWYKDPDYLEEWDEYAAVSSDMILYAKWEKIGSDDENEDDGGKSSVSDDFGDGGTKPDSEKEGGTADDNSDSVNKPDVDSGKDSGSEDLPKDSDSTDKPKDSVSEDKNEDDGNRDSGSEDKNEDDSSRDSGSKDSSEEDRSKDSGSKDGSGAFALNVARHTASEIKSFIEKSGSKVGDSVSFKTEPRASSPYALGELSDATEESALKMLNNVRYIAGLNSDVELSSEYGELAQAASLVNAANDVMSHYPAKPSDMSEELYNKGAEGARRSNIAYASMEMSLNSFLLRAWMSDSDSGNIDRVGHRRWCLNPNMQYTGFGYAKSGSGSVHSAVYAFDGSRDGNETEVAWPAQVMPIEYFNENDAWSVSIGEEVDIDAVKVSLVRKSDGKKWEFGSGSNASGYFNVNNDGFGQTGCIIFRPDGISYSDGDEFQVTISGAKDREISYSVSFFALEPGSASSRGGSQSSANPDGMSFDKSSLYLPIGGRETLRVVFKNGAYRGEIEWKSSDTAVATVDVSGNVLGIASGSVWIRAADKGSGKSCECRVYVASSEYETEIGGVSCNVIYTDTVSGNGKKHFEKGRKYDTKRNAYDVGISVYLNGELLPKSSYKTSFKKNKKPGTGYFVLNLKKKAASKAVRKGLKTNRFTFRII